MRKAQQRLAGSTATAADIRLFGEVAVESEVHRRQQAALALKANVDASREALAHRSALLRQKEDQKKELEAKEFEGLTEAGLNPYEVFRRRDNEAEEARRRQRVAVSIAERTAVIEADIEREAEAARRAAGDAEVAHAFRERYNSEMGVAASQARVDHYIRRVTDEHVPILNPTGRLHLLPSEHTTALTRDFGQGAASEALVLKMSGRHPEVGPGGVMLDSRYRAAPPLPGGGRDDGEGEDFENDAPPDVSAAEGAASAAERAAGVPLETRALTKFEAEKLAAVKSRHRDYIAVPKTMRGRTFAGDAFIAEPIVLTFKDFVPGKTYRQRLSIINRSYAKNTFKRVGLFSRPLFCRASPPP